MMMSPPTERRGGGAADGRGEETAGGVDQSEQRKDRISSYHEIDI